MRWNRLKDNITGACLLADVLMGGAYADTEYQDEESIAVKAALMKVLGTVELPQTVIDHIDKFDIGTFNVTSACKQLELADDRDKTGLIQAVARVLNAAEGMEPTEFAYLQAVAEAVEMPDVDVDAALQSAR